MRLKIYQPNKPSEKIFSKKTHGIFPNHDFSLFNESYEGDITTSNFSQKKILI